MAVGTRLGDRGTSLACLMAYLALVTCTKNISLTLTPEIVGPEEMLSLNCSFTMDFPDGALLYISDQEGITIAVFEKGQKATAGPRYSNMISNLQHPDVTGRWASADLIIPRCYKIQRFKCVLMGTDSQEIYDSQSFQVQRVSNPDLYYNNTCLTCDLTGEVHPLYVANQTNTLECRLDGVTEIVELIWSKDYHLVKGTNLTYEDTERCTYNHTSKANNSELIFRGKLDVTCTAVSKIGIFKSSVVQVISGSEDSTIAPDTSLGDKGTPVWQIIIIVGAVLCGVLIIIIAGVCIYKKRQKKETHKIHYREVLRSEQQQNTVPTVLSRRNEY